MATPPHIYPDKTCEICGATFNRKRFNGRLEDPARYKARRTCSQSCGNTRTRVQRDSHRWRARRIHDRTECAECGSTTNLHVHHKDRDPANNAAENLVTLCASCHLKLHWREDRDYRVKRIIESVGGVTKPRFGGKRELLDGLPPIPLNRIGMEGPGSPPSSRAG